ncbi:PX domain protein (macronuclear) [Tetrahymena thermophila SB210]|uniref:PX domain protein n=1 Tax=Tetrahymena thermophila (strain SB210) TaxID=312017 RepID=Q23FG3_TETTS|nr:PX domain protein [Tetrahymena thermophila SB210]EAR95190.2 PX domain protein [Tetrahymena thermophila SB210]|eukprot:XP_001015435.2 PX domain protein [Tetrahymena thermophila SB210]
MNLQQNLQLISDYSQNKEDVIQYMKKLGIDQQLGDLESERFENIIQDFIASQRSSRKRADVSITSKRSSTASKLDITSNADQIDVTLDNDQTVLVNDRNSRDSNSFEYRGTVKVYSDNNIPRTQTENDQSQSYQKFYEDFYAPNKIDANFSYQRSSTNFYGQSDELQLNDSEQINQQVQLLQQQQKVNQNVGQRQQLQENKLNTIIEREDEEGKNFDSKKTFMISQDSTSLFRDGSVNLNEISYIQSMDGSDNLMRATKSDFGNDCLENIFKYLDQQTNALNTFNWEDLTSEFISELRKSENISQVNQQAQNTLISKQNQQIFQQQNPNNQNIQGLKSNDPDLKQNTDQTYSERIKRDQHLIQMKCKPFELSSVGKYIDENNGKRPYIKISKYQVVDKRILYTIETNLFNSDNPQFNNLNKTINGISAPVDNKSNIQNLNKSTFTNDNSQSIIFQNFETTSVVRSHHDFVRLHRNFTAHYFGYFIPPLPDKFPNMQQESLLSSFSIMKGKKVDVSQISKSRHEKIKIQLQQFLDSLMNSQVLRNSKMLDDFLTIQEPTYYESVCQKYIPPPDFSKLKNVKSESLYSKDGVFNVEAAKSTSLKEYSVIFKEYNQQAILKYNQVKEKSRQVIGHLKNASSSLAELGEIFLDLHRITSEFNEKNKIGANSFLAEQYKECGYFMNNFSQAIKVQHSFISEKIDIPLRYEYMITKQFENLTTKLNEHMGIYQTKLENLIKNKQKLFDSQNIYNWQIDPKVTLPPEAKTNKSVAFNYILPEYSEKLKQFENKLSFLLSILYQESFIYMKSREFNNTKNFTSFLNQNQKVLKNLITQHANCLKKMDENQQKSYNSIMLQIKKDTTCLLQDRTRTILQHNAFII